jgi:hypothetical protein
MTDLIKFMGNAPGINFKFVALSNREHELSPVHDLQRLLDRSIPSLVDYMATAGGLCDIKFHLNFPTWGTASDFECELIYERVRAEVWLRELAGDQFLGSPTTTTYPLDRFRPYNAFIGIIKPGINHTFSIQTKERKRLYSSKRDSSLCVSGGMAGDIN